MKPLLSLQAWQAYALIDVYWAGTVAENAFVDPDLSKDIVPSDINGFIEGDEEADIPVYFISQVNLL